MLIFGPFWVIFGPFWGILVHFGSFLGHFLVLIFVGQKCNFAIFITFCISDLDLYTWVNVFFVEELFRLEPLEECEGGGCLFLGTPCNTTLIKKHK